MQAIGKVVAGAALALGLALSGGGPAQAGERVVVVELYTSQGCSSCPPADALLARLSRRDDVLALALHVNYWDYIGWPDHFANPAFTYRQKAYARVAGASSIYTPQMVVGGRDHLIGTREMELTALIEAERERPKGAELTLTRSAGSMTIRAEAAGPLARPVLVQLIRFKPEETVAIKGGENDGRTVTYTNIVTEWREIGRWTGAEPLSLSVPVPGADPAAVILQEEGPGPVVAAAVAR